MLAHRRLYLLLTRHLCRNDPLETLSRALEGGVDLVQVREKPLRPEDLGWILEVRRLCGVFEVPVLVNDDPRLRKESGAFGLHLGREDLTPFFPGALRTRDFALGLSTHGPADLERALLEEPDYIAIGPCFPTATKGYEEGLPEPVLRAVLEGAGIPTFAIGGIVPSNLPGLLDLGVRRIAVSAAVLGAEDPRAAAAALRAPLDEATRSGQK